ncbi:unnamed protein product, partial [Soboliphyme baturini]|uniref:Secreted protein n=1 Tax=Soboliphyme baturini TaxID=241478 RepID=A0A183JAE6_9BILA
MDVCGGGQVVRLLLVAACSARFVGAYDGYWPDHEYVYEGSGEGVKHHYPYDTRTPGLRGKTKEKSSVNADRLPVMNREELILYPHAVVKKKP